MTVKQPKAKRSFCIFAIVIAVAAALLFFIWCRDQLHTRFLSILLAGLSLAGVAYLTFRCVTQESREFCGEAGAKKDRLAVLGMAAGSRLILFLLGFLFLKLSSGVEGGLLENLAPTWRIGYGIDAPSYLGIAENGYVTSGDAMYHLVFLPFYPLCVKLFSFLTGEYFYAGFLVALLCFAGGCLLLYELTRTDHGRKAGLRAVRYMILMPAGFFYGLPMTESLFLLLSVGCVYCGRRNRIWAAGILGMLAAFTRIQGVLLTVPLAFDYFTGRQNTAKWWIKHIAAVGMVGIGVLGYLLINYVLYGNAFQFMVFQKDHWYQGFNPFYDTVHYETEYLMSSLAEGDIRSALGLFLPCLLTVFGSLRIMIAVRKNLRRADLAYFLVYFVISIGSAWLLSAPRYMLTAYPMAVGLAAAVKKKRRDAELSVILALLQCAYLWMFVSGYPIY